MNFKQNSLFTRNTGFDEEQADVQGGVLAVWGVHPPARQRFP